jgi:hypothetical protein
MLHREAVRLTFKGNKKQGLKRIPHIIGSGQTPAPGFGRVEKRQESEEVKRWDLWGGLADTATFIPYQQSGQKRHIKGIVEASIILMPPSFEDAEE